MKTHRSKKRDKLDGVDAEHIRQTAETFGWQLIRERLLRTVAGKVEELKRPLDAIQTATARGMIEGLELALNVPRILEAEGEKNAGDKRDEQSN